MAGESDPVLWHWHVVTEQVVGGTEVTNLEQCSQRKIPLSMTPFFSIYTVLIRTNSPKQPGCLQFIGTLQSIFLKYFKLVQLLPQ